MDDEEQLDGSWEPMEVDRSLNSTGKISSFLETEEKVIVPATSKIMDRTESKNSKQSEYFSKKAKKFYVNLGNVRTRRIFFWKIKITCFYSFTIIVALYFWFRSTCCHKSALTSVQMLLHHKLYGQSEAIEQMMESFIDDNNKSKITIFLGPTGVGKTYASQIIMEHVQNYSNVFHFTVSSREHFKLDGVHAVLQLCDFILIILDDVTRNNIPVKEIKDILNNSNYLQKIMHIILIFNTERVSKDFRKTRDKNLRNDIELHFREVEATKYFVEFAYLNNEHLRNCIEDSLLSHDYNLKRELIDSMLLKFDVMFDGCKGVDSKIKAMNLKKY